MLHCLRLFVALFALVGVNPCVGAAQATPPVLPQSPANSAACTVTPRSAAELRSLTLAGLEVRQATASGTPQEDSSSPLSPEGEPAAPQIVAAVARTAHEAVACANAGNLPALAALSTNEAAMNLLAGLAVFFVEPFDLGTVTPQILDPLYLDAFIAGIEISVPLQAEDRRVLVDVRDVRVLDDSRATAVFITTLEDGSDTAEDVTFLREEGGRYLFDLATIEQGSVARESGATPAGS